MDRRTFLKGALGSALFTGIHTTQALTVQSEPLPPTRKTSAPPYSMVDGHLHYLDFLQETDGLEKLVVAMDTCGVEQAVLFGMAMAKQWDEHASQKPAYYLSNDSRCYYYSGTDHILLHHLSTAPSHIRRRFLPFVSGINPNDRYAASQLRRLLEAYPGQISGIGEIMSRHDDLTALTYGEPPRADHPALLEVYDLGAEQKLPVLIHHNISAANMDSPLYLGEMERALAHNRKTTIIWAHMGISRRVELSNLDTIVPTALENHPNLYFDISWIVFENYIAKDEASLATWANIFEKYQDRFIFGTDVVGHWSKYPANVVKYHVLLDRLSPKAANKLSSENILRLIGKA